MKSIIQSGNPLVRLIGKTCALAIAMVAAGIAQAMPTVTIESVTQRWPWNNKIDITYIVADGQDLVNGVYYKVIFTANIAGQNYEIDGTKVGASVNTGSHTVTWTPPSDLKARSSECRMSAAVYTSDAPSGNDYMIVNLSDGSIAYEGLLATQAASNERYTNSTYKTDYLVLRKVPKGGTYRTGHSGFASSNSVKDWTTDRDYYIGIYLVTWAQYKKVMGASSASGIWAHNNWTDQYLTGGRRDFCPAVSVTWEGLRGTGISPTNAVAAKADGTFFERLNAKTFDQCGVKGFDIPTEVMFEIAARAGSEKVYFFGDSTGTSEATIQLYSWGKISASGKVTTQNGAYAGVGLKKPNDWGLYDTIGNAGEWLRDDNSLANLSEALDPWTAACSEESTDNRRARGCGLRLPFTQNYYKASFRFAIPKDKTLTSSNYSSDDSAWIGSRVVWIAQ